MKMSAQGHVLMRDEDDSVLGAALAFVDEFYSSDSSEDVRANASVPVPVASSSSSLSLMDDGGNDDPIRLDVDALASLHLSSDDRTVHSINRDVASLVDTTEGVTPAPMGHMDRGLDGSSPEQVSDKPKRRYKTREELVYLREQVKRLEEELAMFSRRQSGPTRGDAMPLASVWQEMAQRQGEQRRNAECENMELRTMLEDQLKVAKSLEQILKKRSISKLLSSRTIAKSKRRRLGTSDRSLLEDPSVVQDLTKALVGMYDCVDEILGDPRFISSTPPIRTIELRENEVAGGASVEVVEARVLPYDYKTTADAMWAQPRSDRFMYQQVERHGDDTIVKAFGGKLEMPQGTWEAHIAMKIHRIVEPHRVIFLATTLVHSVQIPGMPPRSDAIIRYKGWVVVSPLATESVSRTSTPETALVRTCQVATPELCREDLEQNMTAGVLTNLLLRTLAVQLDSRFQMIENVLLERAVAHPGRSGGT